MHITSFRINRSLWHKFKNIAESKDIELSELLRDLIQKQMQNKKIFPAETSSADNRQAFHCEEKLWLEYAQFLLDIKALHNGKFNKSSQIRGLIKDFVEKNS